MCLRMKYLCFRAVVGKTAGLWWEAELFLLHWVTWERRGDWIKQTLMKCDTGEQSRKNSAQFLSQENFFSFLALPPTNWMHKSFCGPQLLLIQESWTTWSLWALPAFFFLGINRQWTFKLVISFQISATEKIKWAKEWLRVKR